MDKDTIYREDAMNAIRETMTKLLRDNAINDKNHDKYFLYKESLAALKELSPAQSKQTCVAEIKIDEETLKKLVDNAVARILEQTEPKKGHWKLIPNGDAVCSVCGYKQAISDKLNFCPDCGVDMRDENDEID